MSTSVVSIWFFFEFCRFTFSHFLYMSIYQIDISSTIFLLKVVHFIFDKLICKVSLWSRDFIAIYSVDRQTRKTTPISFNWMNLCLEVFFTWTSSLRWKLGHNTAALSKNTPVLLPKLASQTPKLITHLVCVISSRFINLWFTCYFYQMQ